MNLRDVAKPYEWQGVTLYFLPYRTLAVDIAIRQLEAIRPHSEWVNSLTGKRQATEPNAQRKAREKAAAMNAPFKGEWAEVDLWTTLENTFVGVLPLVVAVDFPETMSAEVAAFAQFWNAKIADPAERWEMFSTLFGTATSNALWNAYVETRDNPMPGVVELQEAGEDETPLVESAESPLTEPTTTT